MARVDFYVLEDAGEEARRRFACRLSEKAYRLSHAVHIRTGDAGEARILDELLWTFRDGSFLPHEVTTDESRVPEAPVTVGPSSPAGRPPDLVINLAADACTDVAQAMRVAEIVSADDACRSESRRRYARYRELGHTLETHRL